MNGTKLLLNRWDVSVPVTCHTVDQTLVNPDTNGLCLSGVRNSCSGLGSRWGSVSGLTQLVSELSGVFT